MASFVDNFTGKVWDWTKPFQRTGQFPLDRSAIFSSYEDAVKYAKGDAADPDSRALYATSYVGQIISVYEDGKVNVYKIEEDRSLSGIGGGALAGANYTDALSKATADNVGQIIYITEEEEIDGVKYSAGPYIVTGEGTIAKLGTTSASGDLAGDVETLKGDVADLETAIGEVDKKVDAIDLSPYATTESVNVALGDYVSKTGYVAYSQDEKDKLAGIAAGAQVNVIEKVIFNGNEVVVDAGTKSVTLNTPLDVVRGLADEEKVLSLDEATGKLGATVGLTYYTNVEGENPVYEIRLTGKGGEVIASIDAKEFVKDGMLSDVKLVANPSDKPAGTYLVFTWNTELGESNPMYVPVTDLIDVYTAGDGIAIDGKTIKAKVKSGDTYIEVTTEGIASKGIDNAILNAKNAVIGLDTDTESALTIQGVKKYAANLVSTLSGTVEDKVDTTTYNQFVEDTNKAIAAIKVTDVDTTASNGVVLTKSEAGVVGVSVNVDTLTESLVGETGKVGPVSGDTIKLGKAITDGAAENPTEIISATSSIHSAIQNLAGQIQAAVAGGITAIDGGEYITVGGTATSKTLTLNTAKLGTYLVDNKSALKVDSATGKLSLEWETIE
jgi:hypothetical protein